MKSKQAIWLQSSPVPGDVARTSGAFTTLPIRLHQRNDLADLATLQSIDDWKMHMGDGWELKSGSACSPVGNWCAFIFPEALTERLACITYLANIGNIHDGEKSMQPSQQLEYMITCLHFADSTDEVDLQEAQRDHQRFSDALRLHPEEGCLEPSTTNQKHIQDCENRKFKWKNMLAKCVLEIMGIDRESELGGGFFFFSC